MLKLRDVVIFLAGAVFFHMLSHILLPYYIPLPLNLKFMTFTDNMNMIVIVISAIITIALLWWASRLR